jgi:hypothetical protein
MTLVIVLVISHALLIGGAYLLSAGINIVVKGQARAKEILTSLLFWGLFMILGGLCMIFSPWVLPALRQALS